MSKKSLIIVIVMLLTGVMPVKAQGDEEPEKLVSVDYSFDLVSRYLWRGLLYSPNPNIQPYLGVNIGNLTIGSWASYAFSQDYAEVDLFATYTIGKFSATVYDYYNEVESDLSASDYFHWKRKSTSHALEGTLLWSGTESFPLKATAAVFFYGNDRDTVSLDQNYSTYFELGYPVEVGEVGIDFFAGATFNKGLYSDGANFVNLGCTVSKDIDITEKFSLPVRGTFAVNPSSEDVFFVVGITF
jgi:hypothetical protein